MDPLATTDDLDTRGITHDSEYTLEALLDAASAEVRRAAGVPITRDTYTVDLAGPCSEWMTLPGQPIVSVADVQVDGVALADNEWRLVGGRLWRRGGWQRRHEPVEVTVTITGGLVEVPADIVDLVCAMVGHAVNRLGEGYETRGDLVGLRVDDYSEQYTSAVTQRLAGIMELPQRTCERLAARFGGGATVLGTGR